MSRTDITRISATENADQGGGRLGDMLMGNSTDDMFDRAADGIWLFSWLIAVLWVLSIIGFQVFSWLRLGYWPEFSVASAFHYFGIQLKAVYEPESWIGVARIAEWLLAWPLSVIGSLLILFAAWMLRNLVRSD